MDPEPETRLKPRTVPAAMQVAQRRRGDMITHHHAPGSVDLVLSAVFVENLAGKPALQVPSSRAAAPRPPRAVCGTRGSLRTMHGGGSAPSHTESDTTEAT